MVIPMSKGIVTLAIIAVAQLIAILLIYNKIGAVERDIAAVMSAQQIEVYRNEPAKADTRSHLNDNHAHPTEDRLRQIVREELAAQLAQQTGPAAPGDPVSAAGPRDPVEIERQREQVFQQLEYYTSVGRISDMEMQKLQIEIAKLEAAGRNEALRELVRAINSGRLEGRL